MLSKRLIGVITVKSGWAVQSFGYRSWLPLGRPEVLAENLDRWGADEILLQCIDRSCAGAGPDLELLERVARRLSTPLIYAGGIQSVEHAVAAVRAGADRVCADALLHDDPEATAELAIPLGAQAVIAALPLSFESGSVAWLDHRSRTSGAIPDAVADLLRSGLVSEAMIIDHRHEGRRNSFDPRLTLDLGVPVIAFGGISEPAQIANLLGQDHVAAVAIGNFLNYREHAIQHYRSALSGLPLRPAVFEKSLLFT